MMASNVRPGCDGETMKGKASAPAEHAATTRPRAANRFWSIGV